MKRSILFAAVGFRQRQVTPLVPAASAPSGVDWASPTARPAARPITSATSTYVRGHCSAPPRARCRNARMVGLLLLFRFDMVFLIYAPNGLRDRPRTGAGG